MGKSTLTNALVPGAAAPTRELSTALDSGKHTTTYARLYKLPNDTCPGGTLIDSPGLQEFGLKHLTAQEIEYGFAEFRPFLGQCRFRDCQHDAEPGCAIKQALGRWHNSSTPPRPLPPIHLARNGATAMDRTERFYKIDQMIHDRKLVTFTESDGGAGNLARHAQARPRIHAQPAQRAHRLGPRCRHCRRLPLRHPARRGRRAIRIARPVVQLGRSACAC
jgi:hypothetical protein